MKGKIRFLLVVSALFLIWQPAAASNLTEGFLGVPWGGSSGGVEGIEKIHQKGDLIYYIKSDAVYTVGDVELQDVIFGFHRDRFFAVYLRIDSPKVFQAVKDYMQERYGFPKTTWSASTEHTGFSWKHQDIKMKLKTGDKNSRMKLGFYYTPISNAINEKEQEMNREKAYEFLPIQRNKKPDYLPLLYF
jgi:hypothetical protein